MKKNKALLKQNKKYSRRRILIIFSSIILVLGLLFNFRSAIIVLAKETSLKKIMNLMNINEDKTIDVLNYVPGEVLVKFKESEVDLRVNKIQEESKVSAFAIDKKLSRKDKDSIRSANIETFEITDGKSVEDKIKELKSDPDVEYAQPNFIYQPMIINTNDTYRANLWGLDNTGQTIEGQTGTSDADIDAPEAWGISEGSSSVIVAVLDTGVDYNHPDLIGNMWDGSSCRDYNNNALGGCIHGYDFTENDNDPFPFVSSHGTHVAGTIAGVKDNNTGIIGVAPNAKIMAIRTDSFTTTQIIKGIQFAENNGAKIINASFGSVNSGSCSSILDQAQYDAIDNFNGLFIAAAGNGGNDGVGDLHTVGSYYSPVDFGGTTSCWTAIDNVVGVAATDNQDEIASFSDYGSDFIDVGAPGVNIYSTIEGEFSQNPINIWSEMFSSSPTGWTSTGSTWGVGVGSLWSDYAHEPYLANQDNYETTTAIDLSGVGSANATFQFIVGCDTEYTQNWNDYVALEFSSDGTNFSEIAKFNEYSLDTDTNQNNNTDFGSGNLGAYDFQSISIPPSYLTSDFKIRLRWVTNGSIESNYGCFLDNFSIDKYEHVASDYAYYNGTSMATPHVAGLAALAWGYKETATKEEVKDAIISYGDSVVSLSGKVGTGRRINAYETLNYLTTSMASSEKAITSFNLNGLTPSVTGTVNENSHTVALSVPYGTDVTALVPTIAISADATISPNTGVAQDFTNPVTYTVTAQDASTQDYVVTVSVQNGTVVDDEEEDEKNDEIEIDKPSMKISDKIKRMLEKDKKVYVPDDEIKFKGEAPGIEGGRVEIKGTRGGKSEKESADIGSDGKWSEKMEFDKDGTWKVKFTFFDRDGDKIDSIGLYKIKIDTEDPEFTDLPEHLNKGKGSTVWFDARDSERFKKFKVYFNGYVQTVTPEGDMDDSSVVRGTFQLPDDITSGMHEMIVKAYDKAGNSVKQKVQLNIQ